MSDTITKKILIDRIADSTGMKRVAVKQVVQEFLDQVIVELGEGNRLEFRDFGVFEVKQRAPRMAQNPKTLERVPVPAKRTVKFKVGRRMREAMEAPVEEQTQNTAAGSVEVKQGAPAPTAREDHERGVVGSIGAEHNERAHETAGAR
ncbi:MAG: HU family DNA-binding protein [Phycisphaerales bacterium]